MRVKLLEAKPSSKNWWSNARRLMDRKQRISNIPALKQGKEWILEPVEKANCFVTAFESKNMMPDEEANEYSDIPYSHPIFHCGLPTVEATEKALASLDEDSALGPDLVPTRILKRCAKALAPILHLLLLAILKFGEWPTLWREHWVVPLFKRKSVYNPGNYRGIHLTSQISKVAERIIASLFVPQLINLGAYGRNQFAYMPERGARDALAQLVLTWISMFAKRRKIAIYCSDVSGAFDKVNSRRLLRKLRSRGVPDVILLVIQSWLYERNARVAVGGKFSRDMKIKNMVYQGTVLGPPLWNIYYADAALAVNLHGFLEIIFADDLNSFKDFGVQTPNSELQAEMDQCQQELHKWGNANQVSFDPAKESKHILALHGGEGANFRLLGVPFDNALSMRDAVGELVSEAAWKLASIVRSARFFTDSELVNLYKSQLLSYLEYRTAAIYNACDSRLAPLDKFQDKFLRELGISAEDALMHFNLAPLKSRRDMAMLGVLHRTALGKGPDHFRQFFKVSEAERHCTRSGSARHNRQLVDIKDRHFLEIERRSALGLIWVYNRLPTETARFETVKDFQRSLQQLLGERLISGCEDWRVTYCPRVHAYAHPLR